MPPHALAAPRHARHRPCPAAGEDPSWAVEGYETTTGRVLFAALTTGGVYPMCACLNPVNGTCVSVGEIFVTEKVDVPGTWMLTPGETGSIEVTGSDLNPARDRIAILEANGICGISDLVAADIEVNILSCLG